VASISVGVIDRIAGMKIDGRLERGGTLPENGVLVEIEIFAVGLAVDERSLKTEVANAALEFSGGLGWALHGQMSESAKSRGTLLDLSREEVIYGARLALGNYAVLLRLHAGAGEREHYEVDVMLVHDCKASLPEVH
jgi:hypothetical protein